MDEVIARGTAVPALGYGTWELEGDDCLRGVAAALELGYRHLDTAQVYGNEDLVGQALADSGVAREEVFLTTKVWNSRLEPERVRSTTEDSLRRLRTDYVDLLLIHWPVRMDILPQTLEAMRGLQERGLVRHVGVSNFTPAQLREALAHAEVFCNQVEYHPYLGQAALLEVCREQDVLLTAYSPLARGRVLEDPVLREIGEAHGKSAAQVTLRWLVQQPGVATIPKAASRRHIESNLAIFDFALSDAECARIAALERGERIVDPDWADWAA
ncbi:MAG TPA: aldo/keto reductase [Egibacteraceae bacterium]|nr:aldo/keto reductase [Egibacteraceae bacterium]